ncbi:hypothetical protein [Rhizosphaericola mali]|uniref:Uncharacterized protein n=1 Tax=Rhizosphaericola mali TaxID=2545455 RepID=A0A5P2G005_9BACT|nr:hypothetical protein [Rhizosphaericola mali]QES88815.1 hypothetical protein E0W69_009170 [Rhizosphaericola mali]
MINQSRLNKLDDNLVMHYVDDFTGIKTVRVINIAGSNGNVFRMISNEDNQENVCEFTFTFLFENKSLFMLFKRTKGTFRLMPYENIYFLFDNNTSLRIDYPQEASLQSDVTWINRVELSPEIFNLFANHNLIKWKWIDEQIDHFAVGDLTNFDKEIYQNKEELQYSIRAVSLDISRNIGQIGRI